MSGKSQNTLVTAAMLLFAPRAMLAQPAPPGDEWRVESPARLLERSNVLPNSPALVKSLGDAAEYVLRWKLPADSEAWGKRRPEVERGFRQAIGLEEMPERSPLNARVVARHDLGDYVIENLIFESRPGFPVFANVYRPKSPSQGKRPAILCPIGHYLAEGKAARDVQARSIKLAQMGFIVLVYDAIGQGERMIAGNIHHEAGYALLPLGETVAGWMVWDSMRAIDYLVTLPDVDAERIGVTGNSGGGLNTLFTAALDQRVRAAVVVGFTFEFNNWIKYAGTHCTCTHLPGLFRTMEWFEIAGLIAQRPLLMLQGDHDNIFPISGARRAGQSTEALYLLLGRPEEAHFGELAGQPHAYSRPYRESMYGWMAKFLEGRGNGEAIPEGDVRSLNEDDPRLRCDGDRSVFHASQSVVDLARTKAMHAIAELPGGREQARKWVRELAAPPEESPHYLGPETVQKAQGRQMEKFSFVSEDGEYIPGLLWFPEHSGPAKTVIIVDDRGKGAVAQSGLVPPLVETGFAVLSVDLRGRGETLGWIEHDWNTNFRLVANQVLFGRPLAGRRAFDVIRTLDYVVTRKELDSGDVTAVGLGDDALPVLLAAALDARIKRVAVARYFHSFVSQMRAMAPYPPSEMRRLWNSPQLDGHVHAGDDEIDLGSVIPSALKNADVPDIAALIAPRKLLFSDARDNASANAGALAFRFRRVVESAGSDWIRYEPERSLNRAILLEWLRGTDKATR
ncbi:MAG TPA: acetylxylan esterase [Bryobacteraceae bacterium]|nr:acetylxylan esterase [Bryobacteraceae bacterium]